MRLFNNNFTWDDASAILLHSPPQRELIFKEEEEEYNQEWGKN
jgi:hypothetical protein